jgi:hypothetical protein
MSDSPDGYYLAAYCINATSPDRAEVEWIVVFKDLSGQWVDRDGREVHAFHVQPITDPLPAMPAGWLDHLHAEATHFATTHREPKTDLLTALGLKPTPPRSTDRRI